MQWHIRTFCSKLMMDCCVKVCINPSSNGISSGFSHFQETTRGDEHQQRLARLEYENEQRKDMNAAFLKLEEAKEGLERFIRDKRESLANLKPQLASILEVSRGLICKGLP